MQGAKHTDERVSKNTSAGLEGVQGPAVKREQVVCIFVNPLSGNGSGAEMAAETKAYLESRGHSVRIRDSQPSYAAAEMEHFLSTLDAVVIAGGDGTVMGLLPHISKAGVPFYMLPAGNESLIAKEFGMQRNPEDVADRLERAPTQHHFGVVECNGNIRPFFIMASMGLDSAIVADIAKDRTAPLGDIGYVLPAVRSLLGYEAPQITLKVDGAQVLSEQSGYLIVANSKQYAKGLGLVPEAHCSSAELCARFIPGEGIATYLAWLPALLTGAKLNLEGSELYRGKRFEINVKGNSPFPIQADGDLAGSTPAVIELSQDVVRVL